MLLKAIGITSNVYTPITKLTCCLSPKLTPWLDSKRSFDRVRVTIIIAPNHLRPMSVVISSSKSWNLDILLERLWDELKLVRIYTKKSGSMPDWADPLILTPQRGGASVQNAVRLIHAVSFIMKFLVCLCILAGSLKGDEVCSCLGAKCQTYATAGWFG